MRLFLDAHVSGRRIADALRAAGHDVHAASEDRGLDGATDEELLALAAGEKRIMVTFNVRDFPGIAQRWAEAGQDHTGCMIVVGIDHGEFGSILRALTATLVARPHPNGWLNYTCFVARTASL